MGLCVSQAAALQGRRGSKGRDMMNEKKQKRVLLTLTTEEYEQHVDNSDGVCLACGEVRWGDTEPDAEGYPCEACGEDQVMGIENALIEARIQISGDE
jgi:hypothetical protein